MDTAIMIAILVALSPGILLFLVIVACALLMEWLFPFEETDDDHYW